MERRRLGSAGPEVGAIALGCMGMSEFYGRPDEAESVATIHRALELGIDLLDTADMYGCGRNEELLGRALQGGWRERAVVATKCGILRGPDGSFQGVSGHPDHVRRSCDASLRRLGLDHVDLYYLHRVDPKVPIEDTVGAMAELVQAGKVRHLGLSEASPRTLRRACQVHPIAALQTELSLWSRDPQDELLDATRELGVAFVAYSPLGRGFLTARIQSPADLNPDDWRHRMPRFQGENLAKNLELVDALQEMAEQKGVTPAQLALAWVLRQGEHVIALVGTKRRTWLEENADAIRVGLHEAELARLDTVAPPGRAAGERYADMKSIDRS